MDVYRLFEERFDRQQKILESCFDRWDRKLDEIAEAWRNIDQRVTSLEQDARQPRLAMEVDGAANTKTRERTEGAATTAQAMHGDSCSATRIDPGPKTNSTSFGMKAVPPALSCRDDVLVENGDASPKSCLPYLEMRSPSAAGGLLPTGKASTATKITFNRPPLPLYLTEETNLRTSTQPVSYDSSFWNLLATPSCRRVIVTKSGENRMFDPGGSRSSQRLPILGIVARVALWGGSC